MADKPEERARVDKLLAPTARLVQPVSDANIHAAHSVAVREFPSKMGRRPAAEL